jgi:hypothetical protein
VKRFWEAERPENTEGPGSGLFSRRRWLAGTVLSAVGRPLKAFSAQDVTPRSSMHPVLGTLEPVIAGARHVRLDQDRIRDVAGWMAYEGLGMPSFRSPLVPEGNDRDTMDFIFLTNTINFAFTDFERHEMFKLHYAGEERSDSEAMVACLKRAHDRGEPILEGSFLARVTRDGLSSIFTANMPIPMLDERLRIFHEVGRVLEERYRGRFHRFLEAGPRRLYSQGKGLLERLVAEFPSFEDKSSYRGREVAFRKRAQLLWWNLHARFAGGDFFQLEDPESLTVFADYIVPVALRVLGITSYNPELESTINSRKLIPAGSEEEIEIRAFTLWACHLLTAEINRRRPKDRQVIAPVLDSRLWSHFHTTHWPHHLTVTTAY